MRKLINSHSLIRHPPPRKQTAFGIIAALSLSGYVLLRFWFPLNLFFNRTPLADIRQFTPSMWGGVKYAVLLSGLFALYGLAYRYIRQMDSPPTVMVVLVTAVLFAMPLLQTFPFNATDIYRYIIRGRVTSVYGQNPFAEAPDAFSDDPFLPFAGEWASETSPYGPIWELTAAAITRVTQTNLYMGLILFKVLGLLLHLLIAVLIWHLLAEMETAERTARTLLWAWNPALLLTFVVDAHNDGFMLLWLLLGLWVVGRGQRLFGFILMMLAPLTKPIGLLPLPIFFLAIWRQLPDTRNRIRFLLLSVVGGGTAVSLTFLPFGSPLDLVQRLLREAGGAGFSVATLIILVARRLGSNLRVTHLQTGATIFFGLIVLWLLWLTWRGRTPLRGAADIFAAYILQALSFRIWYTVWLFPWLLLDTNEDQRAGYRLWAGLWLLLTAQLSVLIYGHLRVYILQSDHFPAHLIGVPFTFALPLLLAFWGARHMTHET